MPRKAIIRVTPSTVTVPTDRNGIMNYLMQFQTDEQKYLFRSYADFAVGQNWIEDYEGGTGVTVDTDTNTIVVTFVEKENLQAFVDYMTEKGYFTAIQQHFVDNPDQGSFSIERVES